MQFPLLITLHRSRLLDGLLVVVHAVALLCLSLVPLQPLLRAVVAGFVVLSAVRALRRPLVSALQVGERTVRLSFVGAEPDAGRPLNATILPFLIVLEVALEKRARLFRLLLLSDQMTAEDFRQLRVWSRWKITEAKPGS